MSPARARHLAVGAAALAWWLPTLLVGTLGTLCLYARARVDLRRAARLIAAGETAAARRILERWKRRLQAHGVRRGWSA